MRPRRDANRRWRPNLLDLRLEVPIAVENLNSPVPAVGDVHTTLLIHRDSEQRIELPLPRPFRPPGPDELAVLIELRDSGVAVSIGHVNVPRGIPSHVGRPFENVSFDSLARKSAAR